MLTDSHETFTGVVPTVKKLALVSSRMSRSLYCSDVDCHEACTIVVSTVMKLELGMSFALKKVSIIFA